MNADTVLQVPYCSYIHVIHSTSFGVLQLLSSVGPPSRQGCGVTGENSKIWAESCLLERLVFLL